MKCNEQVNEYNPKIKNIFQKTSNELQNKIPTLIYYSNFVLRKLHLTISNNKECICYKFTGLISFVLKNNNKF